MTFINSPNASNIHFQNTSGTLEVAERLRVSTTGSTFNLGITLAAGVFTVCGADGTALSAANPAYVVLQSKASPGLNKIFTITANQTFIDDSGASTIIGNLFNFITGIAVTNDVPFYLYAVSNDDEDAVSFMISRIPHTGGSPAAAKIGKTGSAIASTQGSFFALGDPTVADYDGNPAKSIGSFRMRMSAADDWTVQALSGFDGIGKFQEGNFFDMNRGQNGAAAGKFFADNGGTAPDGSTGGGAYVISREGCCRYTFTTGAIDTAGVGAVILVFSLPVQQSMGGTVAYGVMQSAGGSRLMLSASSLGDSSITTVIDFVNDVSVGSLNNQDLSVNDGLRLSGTLQMSTLA